MRWKNSLFWVAAVVGLVIDQVTKWLVVQNFELGESWPLWEDVFHLTYVTNPGAAFSLFSDGGEWLRWLSLVVSLGLLILAIWGPPMQRLEQLGYGFILAGALGNGLDRFLAGEVVDFFDFTLINFPIFNFADIFINVGIVCLLASTLVRPVPPRGNGRKP